MMKRLRGNSLMEYVLPMGILLIGAGIITTAMVDLPAVMGAYFAKASGSQVSGTQVIADKMSEGASGSLGTGAGNFTSFGGGSAGGGGGGGGSFGGGVYYSPGGRTGARSSVMGSNGNDMLAYSRISPSIAKALSAMPPGASADYKGAVFADAGTADAKAAIVGRGGGAQQIALMDSALVRARSEVTRAAVSDDAGRMLGGDWDGVATVVSNTDGAIKNDVSAAGLKAAANNMKCTFDGCNQQEYSDMMAGELIQNQIEDAWNLSCSSGSDVCTEEDRKEMAEEAVTDVLGVTAMNEASYKAWEKEQIAKLKAMAATEGASNPVVTEVPPEETATP